MATTTGAQSGVTLNDAALFRQACYVNGAWVQARSGATIDVDNPATGAILGSVPKLGATETREAIDAAARAFPEWRRKTAKERAVVLRRWFDLMMQHQEDLARLMTMEQGSRLRSRVARSPTRRRSSSGSARKPSVSTATRFPGIRETSASSCSSSRLVS